jgi:hypothetical protein
VKPAEPRYGIGPGFVVHHTGARWSREDCERVRAFIVSQIDNPSRSGGSIDWNRQCLAQLDAAIAGSFTEQKAAAE